MGLRLVHQAICNLLVAPLSLEGSEYAVPDDKDPGVIFVEAPFVRAWGVTLFSCSGWQLQAILRVYFKMWHDPTKGKAINDYFFNVSFERRVSVMKTVYILRWIISFVYTLLIRGFHIPS